MCSDMLKTPLNTRMAVVLEQILTLLKRKKQLKTIMTFKFVAEKNNEPNLTLITFPIVDNNPLYDMF